MSGLPDHRARRAPIRIVGALALSLLAPLSAAAASAKLAPPVIRESFTTLPCPAHPQSTLDYEGCAERQILRSDRRIDAVARAIFPRLYDDAARRRFIAAQSAWLAYRRSDCSSQSDRYEGGTLAGLVAATCTADRSAERLEELRSFEQALSSARRRSP